jgi:hypothetical protein
MNNDSIRGLRSLLENNGRSYTFYSAACSTMDLTVTEAKFLRNILLEERDGYWVEQKFGLDKAFGLARCGLVEIVPGNADENTQTNIWRITEKGAEALLDIVFEGFLVGR